jgi:hypothetical protein
MGWPCKDSKYGNVCVDLRACVLAGNADRRVPNPRPFGFVVFCGAPVTGIVTRLDDLDGMLPGCSVAWRVRHVLTRKQARSKCFAVLRT